jgi:hypothetical protein
MDFPKPLIYPEVMQTDLRISVKDYRRNKNLRVVLQRVPFGGPQFLVRMNGQPWPKPNRPVSLTRVFTALRKAVVRAGAPPPSSMVPVGSPCLDHTH